MKEQRAPTFFQRNQTVSADVHGMTGTEAATERDEREELNRIVDHKVKGHFPGLWPGVGCADARGPFLPQ